MHRKTSILLLLLLLLASCAALSLWVPGSRPGSSVWVRQRQEGLRLHAAVAARRRLGQRTPVKKPPSPNPNGMTTMVQPMPPPPPNSVSKSPRRGMQVGDGAAHQHRQPLN
ncbi:hypothetical protein SEVIR_1G359700v4 [Setaria viridis]|uniref:Uncharacterized protein n=1 Tax=Setaria viridis TaxID=4556 RepID=A0A4U6WIQ2_SETVI|nr:hypothetical protein SEVIR_1G359700v2 [Setaria viridis]